MSSKRYSVTLNKDAARAVELTARTLNLTPTAYIRYCIEERDRLLQENSNLKAKLRDGLIVRVMPPPTFD